MTSTPQPNSRGPADAATNTANSSAAATPHTTAVMRPCRRTAEMYDAAHAMSTPALATHRMGTSSSGNGMRATSNATMNNEKTVSSNNGTANCSPLVAWRSFDPAPLYVLACYARGMNQDKNKNNTTLQHNNYLTLPPPRAKHMQQNTKQDSCTARYPKQHARQRQAKRRIVREDAPSHSVMQREH